MKQMTIGVLIMISVCYNGVHSCAPGGFLVRQNGMKKGCCINSRDIEVKELMLVDLVA